MTIVLSQQRHVVFARTGPRPMMTIVQRRSAITIIMTRLEKRIQRATDVKHILIILTCVDIWMMRTFSPEAYASVDVTIKLVEIKTGKERI